MPEPGERSGTLLRRVLVWIAAMVLLAAGLFALERSVERRIDERLLKSIVSIAEAYVSHAETSLDFGLPVNGPGSVEEVLQPPLSVATGPDALTVKLEKLGLSERGREMSGKVRRDRNEILVVERAILDSHGEASSRLVLSRSLEGVAHEATARKNWLAAGLAIFGLVFAIALAVLPLRRASLLSVVVFLPAALAVLAAFGLQSIGISRQAAVLAVAETAADIERAARLGIGFRELVGVQDYLKKQVGSNPAIDQLIVRDPEGVQFRAGIESLGAAVGVLLSAPPFSSFVDLNARQTLPSGMIVSAFVNVQPVLLDLAELAAAMLVLWVGGGALLRDLTAAGGRETGRPWPLSAAAAPALLFLLLFAPAGLVGSSVLGPGLGHLLLAGCLALGLCLPRRVAMPALGLAVVALAAGPWQDAALAYGGTGLLAGVVLAGTGRFVHTLHLTAAVLPAAALICAHLLGIAEARFLFIGVMLILAAASIAVFVLRGGSPGRRNLFAPQNPLVLPDASWSWLCLGLIQASAFLLVVIAARHQVQHFSAGPASYVLFAFVLHLIGYRLAGVVGFGAWGRWLLFEASVFAAVLMIVAAHIGGWDIAFNTAAAAALTGAAARWSVNLPFVAPNPRAARRILTAVRLIALAGAIGIGTMLKAPQEAALPAAMICLLGLAPLAYAMIAGLDPDWRRRRGGEVVHAA